MVAAPRDGFNEIDVYQDFGVAPVINAIGPRTILGGSRLSPRVLASMKAANRYHADMKELLEKSGVIVAELLGADAARITTGAAAGLVLGMAACMTGGDEDKMAQLPNTAGLKNEFIIQTCQRFQYDHCLTVAGARMKEVGGQTGTTEGELAEAINPSTAAILYPAHLTSAGALSLRALLEIGSIHNIPVVVDAAAEVYPIEKMKSYPATGADLIVYSGKYFGAPNSTGIICGRRSLVGWAAAQDFIGYEHGGYRVLGRPMKLDRQEVVGMVVALREWLELDHSARLHRYERQAKAIKDGLEGLDGIAVTVKPEMPAQGLLVQVSFDPREAPTGAREVAGKLRDGHPTIWLHEKSDEKALGLWVGMMTDADIAVMISRIREALAQ